MRPLVVALLLSSCGLGVDTPCAADVDCQPGSRCNLALATPSCQQLYSGGAGSACSADPLCASRYCAMQACTAVDARAQLGTVVPTTVSWTGVVDGTQAPRVEFTDDARSDCAAVEAKVEYGNHASLLFVGTTSFLDGQVVPLVADASARAGQAQAPYAVFMRDALSGHSLSTATGRVTLVELPKSATASFRLLIQTDDGVVSGAFIATPVCP